MKRKIILLSTLLILFIGLILSVIYLNDPNIFEDSSDDDIISSDINIIKYPVQSGEIVHTYDVDGQVISGNSELYLEEITLTDITTSNFKMLKSKGDDVASETPIYEYKYSKKSVDYPCKIVDVYYEKTDKNNNAVIVLLNYNKLYIETSISSSKINSINYNTPVNITINGQEYTSSIDLIGYEISDDLLPVQIDLPKNCLPGTKVNITFILDTTENGLFVPEEAIFQDGEKYYANIEDGDSTKQVELKIGQRFEIEEEETTFKYIEIISGASEGDVIVVETVDNIGSKIEESLNNE